MYDNHTHREAEQAVAGEALDIEPFNVTLSKHDLRLTRSQTTTLQINVGLLCNQMCRHCHLDAGPGRTENMDDETIDAVIAYGERSPFDVVDITGGAPELNPGLGTFIRAFSPLVPRLMLRSNLTALNESKTEDLIQLLKSHRVVIVASFPSLNESQVDAQRGNGIFQKSIAALQKLNALGYGQEDSGLELNIVSNPSGAFVPPPQAQMEKRFREVLGEKLGIRFNHLFNFGNVPIGRYREWLLESGNYTAYMQKLYSTFNPCAIEGLMCRTLVSVDWNGYLYDCDFNLAKGLPMGSRKMHVSEMAGVPAPESPIVVSDHCYTCTAGEGFT
ncbi:MAG: arsenosugar biosynthesis radical SAM (seleno)protein ArsS [Desulfobacterales bacterium]